jgi:threonyl-tRNA synthetase
MLHRAVLGSLERFVGVLIEHYAGKFPLWLAPVQVVVASITTEANDYAQDLLNQLREKGIRAELDTRNEKISYKIREHSLQKIPYVYVVGKREAEEKTVAIRKLGGEQQTVMTFSQALQDIYAEANTVEY